MILGGASPGASRRSAVCGTPRTTTPTAGPPSLCTTTCSPGRGVASARAVERNVCGRPTEVSLTETSRGFVVLKGHLYIYGARASGSAPRLQLKYQPVGDDLGV